MTDLPPQARLWNLVRGALTSRAVAIVADLGVADALASGPRSVVDVAHELGADTDTLRRLLRALASDGVFAEQEPGIFRNTDASELLRSCDGWADFAHGGAWHRAAGELDSSGEPSFPRTFGTDFWTWLAARPSEPAAPSTARWSRARTEGSGALPPSTGAGDETVVDVGGGNGSLLVELPQRHPGLRGIVFDLPETTCDEAALGDRCTFIAGSFFERVPTGDVYVLSTILHDWDDASAARILHTIHACAPAGARLLASTQSFRTGMTRTVLSGSTC